MKSDNLSIQIKCNGADKISRALSKLSFKMFLIRIGLLEKEIPDEKKRRKRKMELIQNHKEMLIKRNEQIRKLKNSKSMEEFQKCYEELTRNGG